MTSATLPSSTGIVSSYTYDDADRLTDIEHVKGGSTTVASVAYTLDDIGNRTQRVDQQGTHAYAYDDLHRLTSVTYPGPSTTTYAFDAFGNRTGMTTSAGTTGYTYDDADRITEVQPPSPAAAISYEWDDSGNLVERGSDTFEWDYEDRMVEATVNSVTSTFTYRGDGLRDSRTVGMTTTTFTWDINAGLPVVLDDGSQYLYGAGLSAMKQSGDWFYYLADGLGSTMVVVDADGDLANGYTYDVYGEPTVTGSLANEFDFAGQQTDGSTGLQYLRARYYDPATGTFLSREPLAVEPAWLGGAHSYSNANSCNLHDPSGMAPVDSDPGHGGGGRSDCGGLWNRIKNHVFSMIRAATNWRSGDYGNWHVPENRPFTPKERMTHYAEWNRHQQGLKRTLERWGGSGGQKPCGPPPGGPFGTLTMLVAEYLQHKTLDETAGLVNVETDGRTKFLGRYWSWTPHWPDLPEVSDQDWPIGVPPAPPVPIPVP
jgi:RHS repeat-associated protein